MTLLSIYFDRSEFACPCGCGLDTVDYITFDLMMSGRIYFGRPMHVNSACRCLAYNRLKKSEDTSQHVKCRAVDHYVEEVTPEQLHAFYSSKIGEMFGLGLYDTFVHLDSRSRGPARWDNRS